MIFTARDFNHKTTFAQKQAKLAPVFITNRGNIENVLLSYEQYQQLVGKKKSLAEMLASPVADQIDLEFERAEIIAREVDF